MTYKLGSLFDGSGGFPLAGSLCGIEPVWAAEVEPYPIAVTRERFPGMKHLGDISKINGAEIEPVDIITFGSPCQDLSVAGKRAGLKHEANGDDETTRSGLFMEAVRIIKEMRRATGGQYPRFALWENVPGAFSSQKGEDFRVVLEELIRIVEPRAVMPPVPKAGWAYADSYTGDGWSLAYRVFDAQYWGVPQRRRRIHLVADFRGQCAREVLFEREGLRGYFTEGRTPWEGASPNAQGSLGATDREGEGNGGTRGRGLDAVDRHILDDQGGQCINVRDDGVSPTLRAETHGNLPCVLSAGFCPEQSAKTRGIGYSEECAPTLRAGVTPAVAFAPVAATLRAGAGAPKHEADFVGRLVAEPVPYTLKVRCGKEGGGKGALIQTDKSATLATNNDQYLFQPAVVYDARGNGDGVTVNTLTGDHNNRITDYSSVVTEPIPVHDMATRHSGKRGDKQDGKGNGFGVGPPGGPMNTLTSGERHAVCYAINGEVAGTLDASYYKGCGMREGKEREVVAQLAESKSTGPQYIVRRLTPTECARLQGFPDWWGHLPQKTELTDEEYSFWLDVRNTHARINGKAEKEHTKPQMLAWYNKLHTDGAEYKMWGNGIALPPALYCMQGMTDALEREEDDAWLL